MQNIRIEVGGKEEINITVESGSGEVTSTIERDTPDYNAAIDGMESLLLALACEELLTEGDALTRAVVTALEAMAEAYT